MEPTIQKCCICGVIFKGYGNNPWPIADRKDDRCCDRCNAEVIIPERIKRIYNGNKSR